MAMKKLEMLGLILMMAFFIAPWFIVGLNIWGWLFACAGILVGIWEAYSTIKNDKTISQIFWDYRDENPVKAYVVLGFASLGWVLLILHLVG